MKIKEKSKQMIAENRICFLNIDIQPFTQNRLLCELNEGVLYTPNIDHLVKLQHDREFYESYRQADWWCPTVGFWYWIPNC